VRQLEHQDQQVRGSGLVSHSKNGVASLAYGRSKNGDASLVLPCAP
jgi:hypothetical protein